jgi:hypothetical protein
VVVARERAAAAASVPSAGTSAALMTVLDALLVYS